MSLPTFLLPAPQHSQTGMELVLDGPEAHHALKVRRLKPGQKVRLIDGHGWVALAHMTGLAGAELTLRLEHVDQVPAPSPRITLVQALVKADQQDHALTLATELGADEIVSWQAEHSVVRVDEQRRERIHTRTGRTVQAAVKQCGRPWLPATPAPMRTPELLDLLHQRSAAGALVAVCDHTQPALPPWEDPALSMADNLIVILGPEGGLSSGELVAFSQLTHIRFWHLGPNILRANTATAAALTLAMQHTGRWG